MFEMVLGGNCVGTCMHPGKSGYKGPVMGFLQVGSPTVKDDGKPVGRVGDIYITNCPTCGFGQAISGSPTNKADGIPVHRVGDSVLLGAGMANATVGSVTTKSD